MTGSLRCCCPIGSLCGGVRNASQSATIVTSPGYPGVYPANVRCAWMVEAPEDQQVEVNVTDLAIASSINCASESLEIKDDPLVSVLRLKMVLW